MVKFDNEVDSLKVTDEGLWMMIFDHYLMVQVWEPGFLSDNKIW